MCRGPARRSGGILGGCSGEIRLAGMERQLVGGGSPETRHDDLVLRRYARERQQAANARFRIERLDGEDLNVPREAAGQLGGPSVVLVPVEADPLQAVSGLVLGKARVQTGS